MGFHHVGQVGFELLTSSDPPALASQSAGIIGAHQHAQLIFVFLVETGFRHVVQASLELLSSSDSPVSASQSAGVTGVSHHIQPKKQVILGNFLPKPLECVPVFSFSFSFLVFGLFVFLSIYEMAVNFL